MYWDLLLKVQQYQSINTLTLQVKGLYPDTLDKYLIIGLKMY